MHRALSQAVAEALVKYIGERNGWSPANNFEENVYMLNKRRFISEQLRNWLFQIWQVRDTYHHLNNSIATGIGNLEQIGFLIEIRGHSTNFPPSVISVRGILT